MIIVCFLQMLGLSWFDTVSMSPEKDIAIFGCKMSPLCASCAIAISFKQFFPCVFSSGCTRATCNQVLDSWSAESGPLLCPSCLLCRAKDTEGGATANLLQFLLAPCGPVSPVVSAPPTPCPDHVFSFSFFLYLQSV